MLAAKCAHSMQNIGWKLIVSYSLFMAGDATASLEGLKLRVQGEFLVFPLSIYILSYMQATLFR